MNKKYARKLYGTKLTDRRAGHSYLLHHGTDEQGNMTEKTPAVIHCRNDAAFTAHVEQFLADTGSTATFPQVVQAVAGYELSKAYSHRRLFDTLGGRPAKVAEEALGVIFGSVEAANRLTDKAIDATKYSRELRGIGPHHAGKANGLLASSPAQVAAEVLGMVSYVGETDKRLPPRSVTLPRSICPIARGRGVKSSQQPLAGTPIGEDSMFRELIKHAVQATAVDAILWSKNVTIGRYSAKGAIRYVSRFYAGLLTQEIVAAGLLPRLREQFQATKLLPSVGLRAYALDSFWLTATDLGRAPSRDFEGLLPGFVPGFAKWLSRTVFDLLQTGPEEQLANGVAPDLIGQVLFFPGHYRDTTARWRFAVHNKLAEVMGQVITANAEQCRTSMSALPPMIFPPLPYVGECGGQLLVEPTKRRTNWVIKRSREGLKQEHQRSLQGIAVEVLRVTSKAAAKQPEEGLSSAYLVDLSKL